MTLGYGYTSAMKGIPGYEYACVPYEVGMQTVGTVDETTCQYALGNVDFAVGTWDTDAWMDSRDIPWFGIYINRPVQVAAQTVDGVQIPAMNLNLLCTHLKMGVGGDPSNWSSISEDEWSEMYGKTLHANLHITAIQGDYLIVGVYTSTVKTQSGAGFFRIPYRVDGGKVRVRKAPADTAYRDCIPGNPAYSLAGATYGLYRDAGCTDLVQTLTTQNGEGLSEYSGKLPSGTYYLKELSAPKGYRLDGSVTAVALSGTDVTVTVSDPPMDDPASVLVQKVIEGAAPGELRGDITTLAGIQFRVDYYPGLYDSAEAAQAHGPAKASAVFETDELGELWFASATPVNGTVWPYQNESGLNTIPLGTVVITELQTVPGLQVGGASVMTFTDGGNGQVIKTPLAGFRENQ